MRRIWGYWKAAWQWNAVGAAHNYFGPHVGWSLERLEVKTGSWNDRQYYRSIEIRWVKSR